MKVYVGKTEDSPDHAMKALEQGENCSGRLFELALLEGKELSQQPKTIYS